MNEAVQAMIDDVRAFESRSDEILLDLVKDREAMVVRMNVDQLEGGVTNQASRIVPKYRPSTIERKKRKGQPYDRVTLKDEGDFHASFFVRYGGAEFELDAKDEKRVYLERKYGEAIYGLTADNVDRLRNDLREDFVNEFRKTVTQ